MKKNRTMRVAVVMLALALITCCFVGSTFAKYVSTKSAQDAVTVAKWSFKVNGADIATSDFTFNLFNTITDDDKAKIDAGTDDDHVVNDLIAPGTGGKFAIELVNDSQVYANYSIALADGDTDDATTFKNVPLLFSLDGETWKALADFTIPSAELAYTDGADDGADEATVTIYWMWAFEQTDVAAGDLADTTLGITPPEVIVKATITATQVD